MIKKVNLLFVCVFLLTFFVSCEINDTLYQSEGKISLTEKADDTVNIYDAFDISSENRDRFDRILYHEYKSNAELQLKFYEIGVYDLCEYLPNTSVDEILKNSKHRISYYADASDNIYGELAGCQFIFDEENADEIKWFFTGKESRSPCWEMIYEYIDDPHKVFGEDTQIENIYCFSFRTRYAPCIAEKDLIIYYETSKGKYILYRPFDFKAYNTDLPIYEDGNAIPVGYSDTLYLFPASILSQCNDYIQSRINNISEYPATLARYYGECQLHRIIDLEPYKFVPGQLPQ